MWLSLFLFITVLLCLLALRTMKYFKCGGEIILCEVSLPSLQVWFFRTILIFLGFFFSIFSVFLYILYLFHWLLLLIDGYSFWVAFLNEFYVYMILCSILATMFLKCTHHCFHRQMNPHFYLFFWFSWQDRMYVCIWAIWSLSIHDLILVCLNVSHCSFCNLSRLLCLAFHLTLFWSDWATFPLICLVESYLSLNSFICMSAL